MLGAIKLNARRGHGQQHHLPVAEMRLSSLQALSSSAAFHVTPCAERLL